MTDAEPSNPLDYFESCIAQSRSGLGRATVAVLGRAGAGKSTLINAVFGAGVAETGVGAPVTGSLAEYRVPGSSLTLLDSWGLELGGQALEGASRLVAEEIERRAALPVGEALHAVWYCVDTSSDRFEPAEEELVRRCATHVPTIVVLTKAVDPDDVSLRTFIEGLGLPVEAVLPVLAEPRLGHQPYGIEALGATTASVLPEAARRAFVVAQRYAIEQQVVEARGTVQRRSLAAAQLAIGTRGLDADRLARHQLRMLAEITVLFSLSVPDPALRSLGLRTRPRHLHLDGTGRPAARRARRGRCPRDGDRGPAGDGRGRRGFHPRAGRRLRAALSRAGGARARGPAAADGSARALQGHAAVTSFLDNPGGFATERRRRAVGDMPHCTIVVVGKTGVGKSTLINGVFGEQLAETGVGRPVTQHFSEYSVPGVPVTIVDSRGIELSQDLKAVTDELLREIEERLRGPADRHLHVLWYCISAEGARFEPETEGALLRAVGGSTDLPCMVVLTKAYDPGDTGVAELKRFVEGENLPLRGVVPVLAESRYGLSAHGLEASSRRRRRTSRRASAPRS